MSRVTNVILHYGMLKPSPEHRGVPHNALSDLALFQINEAMMDQGVNFVSIKDGALPAYWYGGSKVMEQDIAIGAFNRLNLGILIEELRKISWHDPERIQLIICEQDDNQFRIINVFEEADDD